MVPIFVANAFARNAPFTGNPAAVCLLSHWPSDTWLQQVAEQNNLSETAFVVQREGYWDLRWFTPAVEVSLCGHATLAAGHVLYTEKRIDATAIRFASASGDLIVQREGSNEYQLDFPVQPLQKVEEADLESALGSVVVNQCRGGEDLLVELQDESAVAEARPDMVRLAGYNYRGVVITARGRACDFVSRFFGPNCGVPEDPATGSAHCALAPYWSERLQKANMHAEQLSARGGALRVSLRGDRVLLTGRCVTHLRGTIEPPKEES